MGVGSGARVENADVLGLGGRALLSAESGGSGLGGGLDGPVTEQDVEIDWQLAGRRTGSRSDYGALAACPPFLCTSGHCAGMVSCQSIAAFTLRAPLKTSGL